MHIQSNFSLKKFNTFGIEAKAKQFVAVHSIDELKTILKEHESDKKFILGGGSNMLLTQDIDALVIHVDLKEKKSSTKTTITFGWKVGRAKTGMNLYSGPSSKISADWKICR